MKKLIVLGLITLLAMSGIAFAASSNTSASSKPREPLEKLTFIHYKDGAVKPVGGAAKAPQCYKLLGVKWKILPITYVIDTDVDAGAVVAAANEWDDHTSTQLFDGHTIDSSANFDDYPDERNEYSFGDYQQSGVIAVTRVWYTRYSRQIVEYDVMFDSDFTWGNATQDPTLMDWQNIATHETGHGLGLADVYSSSCSAVTMYGYSWEGDTSKSTLEQPDITGLHKLYGA